MGYMVWKHLLLFSRLTFIDFFFFWLCIRFLVGWSPMCLFFFSCPCLWNQIHKTSLWPLSRSLLSVLGLGFILINPLWLAGKSNWEKFWDTAREIEIKISGQFTAFRFWSHLVPISGSSVELIEKNSKLKELEEFSLRK